MHLTTRTTEKYDAEDVATNEPLKDVIVSNGADTTNMVNQANIEEKRMESIEDDPKQTEEQNQQETSEESDGTVATNIVNEANLQKESDQAHLVAAEDEQDQQKSSEKKDGQKFQACCSLQVYFQLLGWRTQCLWMRGANW